MKVSHCLLPLIGLTLSIGAPAAAQVSTQGASDTAQTSPTAGQERRICRRMPETGSLARRRRQCYTRAEWDRIAEAARLNGQRLQDDMRSGPGNN